MTATISLGTAVIDTLELELVAEPPDVVVTQCVRFSDRTAIENELRRMPERPQPIESKTNRSVRHQSRDEI